MNFASRACRWRVVPLAGLALLVLPLLSAPSRSPGSGAQQGAETNRYIGAAMCKNCHQTKESGDQYGVWQHEKHAKAFEELASPKAKTLGKERGVDDPQSSEKCLKCHVTAYGKPPAELHRSFDPKLGVQCETCHGPGEKHKKARMAAAATADTKPGESKPAYVVIPNDEIQKNPDGKTCVVCHNDESPGYKPFCFHKFVDEIRHLNPLKPRTDAERAAMLVCGCDAQCICRKGTADGKCASPPKPKTDGKAGEKKDEKKQ